MTASSEMPPPQLARLQLGIRPEYVEVHSSGGANRIPVEVTAIHDHGTHLMVQLAIGSNLAWSKVRNTRHRPQTGAAFAYLPMDKCGLFVDDRRLA
jgi:glycerol transport system ATP-binding protein